APELGPPGIEPPALAPARPAPAARRAAAPARAASVSWSARVRAGEFRDVIDEAEKRGLDAVLRGESQANLMALADAARYAGSSSLARRTLGEVRQRFPGTAPAHRAAFLLGRMAEDQDGNLATALDWYGIYLHDAIDDSLRAEAMGRQMSVTLRLLGAARARPLAQDYLGRYPRGAYADAARAIIPH